MYVRHALAGAAMVLLGSCGHSPTSAPIKGEAALSFGSGVGYGFKTGGDGTQAVSYVGAGAVEGDPTMPADSVARGGVTLGSGS